VEARSELVKLSLVCGLGRGGVEGALLELKAQDGLIRLHLDLRLADRRNVARLRQGCRGLLYAGDSKQKQERQYR
jgi:hypothetical protein